MKKLQSILLSALISATAFAETVAYKENDVTLRVNADVRARWDSFSRTVTSPDGTGDNYPPTQYLRIRTRLGAGLDFGEDMTINLRLTNRTHYVSSSPAKHNNNGSSTWEFPDELILDQANIVLKNLLDQHLTLTIGRQTLPFAYSKLFADNTPYDQGRSAYTDGILAAFEFEQDKLSIFATYDSWKDRTVFINDQNRRLNSSDIATLGSYWTHNFSTQFNSDMYYIFSYSDDNHPDVKERNHPADWSANIHTLGTRLFGKPLDWMDYSLELARQMGKDSEDNGLEGLMVDARANFTLPLPALKHPVFGLEYTHFSGDKPGTGRQEGWRPLYAQAPLWDEELIPMMLNGNWSNLTSYRGSLTFKPTEKTSLILAVTQYVADEASGDLKSGSGNNFGLLLSAIANYKFNQHLSFRILASDFTPGNYFASGHDSFWTRFEVMLSL